MSQSKPRTIPLAAAALSLSFGNACSKSHAPAGAGGGGAGPTPDGSGDALSTAAERYVDAYCDTLFRCYPEDFDYYFANDAECIRYYDDFFGYYYTLLLDSARDRRACEGALVEMLDCYLERYHADSCSSFAEYYCDGFAYYAYYDYYGVYYVVVGDDCSCWYTTGAHYACL